MTGGFTSELHTGDGFVVVSLTGELDLAEGPGLRKSLERVLRTGTRLVVIDAAELTFLDSSGIGLLVAAHNQQQAAGALLVIANLKEGVGRPIRLTEVDTAVPVHWAATPVTPWADEAADPVSILTGLGFSDAASALAAAVDVDAEPIG
ncbi:MAG: STAS domain-containing protein [Actinomycetes bacterium]